MERSPARLWSLAAGIAGLLLVVAHVLIRSTSRLGWVAVFQFLAVAPWLVVPFVPIALHVTRRTVTSDLATRWLVVLGSTAFLGSAFTLDVSDSWGECFLGSCREPNGPDLWWESIPMIGATPFFSIALSWLTLVLLVAAMIRTRSLRRASERRPAPPAPGAWDGVQTQSVPGMPSGMAMTEPGPMASDAER